MKFFIECIEKIENITVKVINTLFLVGKCKNIFNIDINLKDDHDICFVNRITKMRILEHLHAY